MLYGYCAFVSPPLKSRTYSHWISCFLELTHLLGWASIFTLSLSDHPQLALITGHTGPTGHFGHARHQTLPFCVAAWCFGALVLWCFGVFFYRTYCYFVCSAWRLLQAWLSFSQTASNGECEPIWMWTNVNPFEAEYFSTIITSLTYDWSQTPLQIGIYWKYSVYLMPQPPKHSQSFRSFVLLAHL